MATSPPHQNSTMPTLWELRRQKGNHISYITVELTRSHRYIQTRMPPKSETKPKTKSPRSNQNHKHKRKQTTKQKQNHNHQIKTKQNQGATTYKTKPQGA